MGTTNLLLGMHGHQPVGNFPWVLGEAYAKAYGPFLEVIERHPRVRWTLHFSGPLVDWFQAEHPDYLRRLKALVRKGQVEVMSGGYAEPILPLIPERDAIGQLQRLTRQLTRLGLGPCRGAWLPERVWEPSLPRVLRAAGLEYTIVDDHHLTLAGLGEAAGVGYWTTEDAGEAIALFPSSKPLRYLVPFQPVEQVIEHLRGRQSQSPRAVVLADDVEKFGLWPGTFRWVYEEGWLDRFCRALAAESAWLTTTTFSRYLDTAPSLGRVYVPGASYEEMLQWSGGQFRNFLAKYPEVNTMHKKMLWVSRRLEAARRRVPHPSPAARRRLDEAQTHLYRGQCNCAYWHGVFGGVYLAHLRSAVYRELLTAESSLDHAAPRGRREGRRRHGPLARGRPWAEVLTGDFDGDGAPEPLVRSGLMDIWLDPSRGGAIVEWDDKTRGLNLLNTLTRRPEAYHATLAEAVSAPVEVAAGGPAPATIHAGVRVKEPGLHDHLVYDPYRRVAALDHLLPAGAGEAASFARGQLPDGALPPTAPYAWRVERPAGAGRVILSRRAVLEGPAGPVPVRVTKTVTLAARVPTVTVAYTLVAEGAAPTPLRFGSEWNLALKDPHFNRVGTIAGARRLTVTDAHADVQVEMTTSVPAACWYFPVETVSDSESGLERTYQHVCLTYVWDLVLAPRRPWRVQVIHTVSPGGVHGPA